LCIASFDDEARRQKDKQEVANLFALGYKSGKARRASQAAKWFKLLIISIFSFSFQYNYCLS
jgi:Holliday junction resolvasome RuvABC DNA-binding subunit